MSHPSDEQLDESVATTLRIGVSLAALVVIVGAGLLLRHPLETVPNYRTFQPGNPALQSMSGILQGSIDLAPRSVIQLGLLILIATPVARVVLCVIGFARQKSVLYTIVSVLVLSVLLFSLIKG